MCEGNADVTDGRKESRAVAANSERFIHLASPARFTPSVNIEDYLEETEIGRNLSQSLKVLVLWSA